MGPKGYKGDKGPFGTNGYPGDKGTNFWRYLAEIFSIQCKTPINQSMKMKENVVFNTFVFIIMSLRWIAH